MDEKPVSVLIGIQARSTSSRLPNKGLALIGGKTMTQHVIDAAAEASRFIPKNGKSDIRCSVALLVPKGDPLADTYRGIVTVFEGPENDVLGRYALAYDVVKPSHIVRVTGDCPLLPPYLITALVRKAIAKNLDYCSNVDERWRSDLDGFDCEIISARAFEYLLSAAKDKEAREHVTLYLRRNPPSWARVGSVIGFVDLCNMKLSVDTQDDLERVRAEYQSLCEKQERARRHGHIVLRF